MVVNYGDVAVLDRDWGLEYLTAILQVKVIAVKNTSVAPNLGLWESFKRNDWLAMLKFLSQCSVEKLVSLRPILLWGTEILWIYIDKALSLGLLGCSCHFVIEYLLGLCIMLDRYRLQLILNHLNLRQLN